MYMYMCVYMDTNTQVYVLNVRKKGALNESNVNRGKK